MPSILTAAVAVQSTLQTDSDRHCCVFAQRVCETAYEIPPAGPPLLGKWRLFDINEPWSPVQAAQEAGIADRIILPPATRTAPPVGPWCLVQGWRGRPGAPGATGHTFFFRMLDEQYGILLDSAGSKYRPAPGPQVRGFTKWLSLVAEYQFGLGVAVLGPPRRI